MSVQTVRGVIARFIPWLDGVPLELLQRVTGHRTTEVVLKHYFRPGREDFRQILSEAMPNILSAGHSKSPKDRMQEILEKMSAKSWKADRDRLLQLLAEA